MAFTQLPAVKGATKAQRMDCRSLQFNTDCHIVVPSDTGLTVLLFVLLHTHANPGKKLLVTGHTDGQGEDDRNLVLSTDRALNVLWLLLGDKDRWAESAVKSYKHCVDTRGRQDLADRDVEAARKLSSSLPAVGDDAWKSADSWKTVFDLYTQQLERWCGKSGTPTLVKGIFSYVDADGKLPELQALRDAVPGQLLLDHSAGDETAVLGCAWQEEKLERGEGVDCRENRRIEFLWYEKDPHDVDSTLPFEQDGQIVRPDRDAEAPPEDRWGLKAIVDEVFHGPWEWKTLECPQSIIELGQRTVLIIDASGSMGEASEPIMAATSVGSSYKRFYDACKALVQATIDEMEVEGGAPQVFSLVAFNSSLKQFEHPEGTAGPFMATTEHKDAAKTWLDDSIAPQKMTDLWAAYVTAVGIASKDGKPEEWRIVLFSDGLPTTGNVTNEGQFFYEAEGKAIPIDTYGFMSPVEVSDELREIIKKHYWTRIAKGASNQNASGFSPRMRWCMQMAQLIMDSKEKELKKELKKLRDMKVPGKDTYLHSYGNANLTEEERAGVVIEQTLLGWFLSELSKKTGGTYSNVLTELEKLSG